MHHYKLSCFVYLNIFLYNIVKIVNILVVLFLEEIFGDNSAMWFAPDGSKLAYVRFNDSMVSQLYAIINISVSLLIVSLY